jgi:ribosomal-protein-serine acetyltransferase
MRRCPGATLRPVPRFTLDDGHSLRPLDEADAGELHALIERNRAELARWIQWAQEQTPEQTLEFIRRARAKEAENRGLDRALLDETLIIGVVGLPSIDVVHRTASIGYWLDRAHQGRGVATAAVAAIVEHAFNGLHLNRLEIRADMENAASRAVAERLGFRFEGTLREAYRVGDRYSNDAVYSLLAADRGHPRSS